VLEPRFRTRKQLAAGELGTPGEARDWPEAAAINYRLFQSTDPTWSLELGPGFGTIINAARLVPNTVDNQVNGFKIFAIDPAACLRR
jgi:hypothetical protein